MTVPTFAIYFRHTYAMRPKSLRQAHERFILLQIITHGSNHRRISVTQQAKVTPVGTGSGQRLNLRTLAKHRFI